ncbi:nucleotidyl transferase AbiEii/AbiGii toxin family protein [Streptomyces sp. NPDC060005]|uniref:nucleotidyl transferase AbiEii/AbiGii toxin family protein n=1 Tax=Streptomyces sp. NPDC060005 TaxID=3347034 RepID=UPI0036A3D826
MSGTAWDGFGWQDAEIPREPLDEATRVAQQLPSTLRPVPGEDVVQRPVFDPSLKHFQNAYRATDPRFSDPTRGASWRAARRRALHLVLDAIAASQWREALVLRGSVLMSLWFPDEAREPGDLDFVVVPHTWEIDEDRTHHMLHGIAAAAQTLAEERGSEVEISASGAVIEGIWTYDRVPGSRMVLPWGAPGLPGGHVQLDFVFNEHLPEASEPVELPGGTVLQAATPDLSLAWKLMWLINDMHPQGKDLYDAVLLAERHVLGYDLLREVFRLSGEWPSPGSERRIRFADVTESVKHVEWDHFVTEYPRFKDAEREYAERLVRAVATTFQDDVDG